MTVMTQPREMLEADAGTTIRVHSTTIDDDGVEWRKIDDGMWQRTDTEVTLQPQAFRSAVRAGLVELVEEDEDPGIDLPEVRRLAVADRDRQLHESLVEMVDDDDTIERDQLWAWMDSVGLGRPQEEITARFEISGTTTVDAIPDPDAINSSWDRHSLDYREDTVEVSWSMDLDDVTIPRTSGDSCEDVDEAWLESYLDEQGVSYDSGTLAFNSRRCSQCS